ncbi:uncharacterized protein LOC133907674 isoform X2 [Phragmites australis]|uniref:uncharacterized protein LOC133907674 isoform X2 n=1 Tax=Phragmites australis TaxID=29695 RepID=UPI002D793070|nr:uncharacterized protein LOC133907674 isoform X2 [Phragmites australis]
MASSSSSSSNPASQPPLLLPPPEPAPAPPSMPEARPRPSPTLADNVRGLLKSGEALIRAAFRGNNGHRRPPLQHHQLHPHQQQQQQQQQHHRPADIMKRLQRETFSDVMKLKDKHEQIERIVSLYKNGKGFQFPDFPIQVKIALDAVGAMFLVDGDKFKEAKVVLDKAGYRTGLSSRFIFESKTRGKDTIAAELSTRLEAGGHLGEATGRPVELTRLQYCARINKRLSMILVPLGAQCNNFLHDSRMIRSQASFDGPPLFSEHHNCAAGLRIKGSKFTASFAQLLFGSGAQDGEHGGATRTTTFGKVSCEPAKDVKLRVSGLWQACTSSSRFNYLGILSLPIGSMIPVKPAAPGPGAHSDPSAPRQPTGSGQGGASAPSIAVMVDCELYETIKAEGWFQMERSRNRPVRCGFSLSDTPESKLGWGVRMGGTAEGEGHSQHLEGFLNFDLGKGARLQPGLVYAMEGGKWTPALLLRSSWFM